MVTRLHLPHAIVVRLHVHKSNVVILIPDMAGAGQQWAPYADILNNILPSSTHAKLSFASTIKERAKIADGELLTTSLI